MAPRHPNADLNTTQKEVLRVLSAADHPLTAYAVLERIRSRVSVTPPTIYRSLAKLIELGLIHRIETLNAYMVCCGHHDHGVAAFAICSSCGSVEEFADPQVSRGVSAWSQSRSFKLTDTTVELKGLCAACAA